MFNFSFTEILDWRILCVHRSVFSSIPDTHSSGARSALTLDEIWKSVNIEYFGEGRAGQIVSWLVVPVLGIFYRSIKEKFLVIFFLAYHSHIWQIIKVLIRWTPVQDHTWNELRYFGLIADLGIHRKRMRKRGSLFPNWFSVSAHSYHCFLCQFILVM